MKFLTEICPRCRSCICCEKIEPPFFTQYDIDHIEQKTALCEKDFVVRKKHKDGEIKLLKRKSSGECLFFDTDKKKCKIYDFRPLDCQLFPLDIYEEKGKYFWICYNVCKLGRVSSGRIQEMVRNAESRILPWLKNYVEEYADQPMNIFSESKSNWRIIAKISWKE